MSNLKQIPANTKAQVRTFFLQSFERKLINEDFTNLDQTLMKSLQSRMKFEICEMKINHSNFFLYLRLFFIKKYQDKVTKLQEAKLEPKTDGMEQSIEYKNFIFFFINSLEICLNNPGQKMVTSNDDVVDKNDQFLEDSSMYVIINGNYKVSTAMYLMKNRKKELDMNYPVDSSSGQKPAAKHLK